MLLNGKLETIRGFVTLQFEPVAALASLWLVLENPEPFDVSVFFIANAANHAIRVHCVDDIRILLGSLPAFASLQEEGILKRQKLCKFFLSKFGKCNEFTNLTQKLRFLDATNDKVLNVNIFLPSFDDIKKIWQLT